MEAKVDIRKLQVLNDRINQTIEALNQVRLTVHGLGHTSPYQQMNPFGMSMGFGWQQPFGIGQQPFGIGQQPYGIGQPTFGLGLNPLLQGGGVGGFGLQHTSPFASYNPLVAQNPWLAQTLGGGIYPGFSGGISPLVAGGVNPFLIGQGYGTLLHSSPELIEQKVIEARAGDPTRIASTFPYVLAPHSPIVGLW